MCACAESVECVACVCACVLGYGEVRHHEQKINRQYEEEIAASHDH